MTRGHQHQLIMIALSDSVQRGCHALLQRYVLADRGTMIHVGVLVITLPRRSLATMT